MNILGYMQKIGKALMLPIAVLPVAALLLRLGQPDLFDIPFMAEAGNAIFSNLPLLFAMGIAVGVSVDGAGAAALAGAVGYFILKGTTATIDPTIDMSFFGGIISGIVAGHTYNRFYAVSLPPILGFFSGKRLVPIMTGLFMLLMGWACGYIWPAVQHGIDLFGHAIADSGSIGQFIFGTLNRALLPLGLHHVLNSYFWFGLGDYTNAAGLLVNGDLHRFFAGDPQAGVFMTGFFPVMMFGLPAAALAMYLTADIDRRAQVGGMLFSVAVTAFLTGITEPLEFMFMFLAPGLYAIHAVLTGVSMALTTAMGALTGFGFSAGLFDMVLNWGLATNPWTVVFIGFAYAVLYFCVFYFGIKIFNLKTPGREVQDESLGECVVDDKDKQGLTDKEYKARQYIKAIGGVNNLTVIDACITRLRLTLVDPNAVNESVIKALGASGMIRVGEKNLQVIVGTEAEIIAGEMRKVASSEDLSAIKIPKAAVAAVKEAPAPIVAASQIVDRTEFSQKCIALLGGSQNLTRIDASITRLRLTLKDTSKVSEEDIKSLGAIAIVRIGDKNLQIVVGPEAEMIADEMNNITREDKTSTVKVAL